MELVNKQLFIVMVWAFLPDETMYLGEHPVIADTQYDAMQPAIDELVSYTNLGQVTKMPSETEFFATIKTQYRGRYYFAGLEE